MAITSQVNRVAYAGNGSATSFSTTFKFLDPEHVRCVFTTIDGEDVELVLDTDYTVTGEGEDAGGTVTFPAGASSFSTLASGETLTIYREVPLTQETDWENSDEIDVEEVEAADDKLTMIAQQLSETLGRSIKVPVSSSLTDVECQLPEAGKALIWNATADGILNGDVDVTTLGATAYREEFTATDGQTLFELTTFTYTPSADNLAVYVDGVLLDASEYSKTSTSSFTLATPAVEDEVVVAVSANMASLSDINAATDAAEAAQSAAETAQGLAEAAQNAAEAAETDAEAAQTAAEAAQTAAESAQTAAETARDEAEAAAAGVNLPSIEAGDADKLLQVKDDESGYELKSAADAIGVATTSNAGIVELATQAEAEAQASSTLAVPPSGLTGYLKTTLDASLDSDHTVNGLKATFTAGESLVFGDVCYYKSDGKMWKADADAASTMPVVAMAAESIDADDPGEFLLFGFARDDSWSFSLGDILYASTSGGAITTTAPSGSGDQIQIIGVALNSNAALFDPDKLTAEVS